MAASAFERELDTLLRPEVESLGVNLWGLKAESGESRRIVRIYIEGPEGVTIDQCAKVSRHVAVVLEAEDIIPGAYNLEVSSPGLDRIFFTQDQMTGYVGKKVEIKLYEPIGQRRNFRGILESIEEGLVTIDADGESIRLEWESVKEARLVPEF